MSLKNIAKLVKDAKKEPNPAGEFLYMLERSMEKDNTADEYQGGVYRPSSIGGCLRQQYYMVENMPREEGRTDAAGVGIAESGTDRHERIQGHVQRMKKNGFEVEWIDVGDWIARRKPPGTRIVRREGNETRLYNDILNLWFKCDGVIKFKGKYYILEIKTETSMKYRAQTEIFRKHKKQAACYSLGIGIDDIVFIYENRDLTQKKSYNLHVTSDMHSEVVEEIETVETYRKLKQTPPMIDDKSWCTYCDFKKRCKAEGRTEEL